MTEEATWYLGPRGALRALPAPEPGVVATLTRHGGVHQAISGARVMDVTGHRHEYTLTWNYLEEHEWQWLQALHTRLVPGPHFLVNPLRTNRLSVQSSTGKGVLTAPGAAGGTRSTAPGFMASNPHWMPVRDWPEGAGPLGSHCIHHPGHTRGGAHVVRFDYYTGGTPVFAGEALSASIYLKAEDRRPLSLVVDWYDSAGQQTGASEVRTIRLTSAWTRWLHKATVPEGTATAVFALIVPADPTAFFFAAPQLQSGPLATSWEIGGGTARVVVDQLQTSSPRYPLTDCSLTLLEA
ncbi:hypothetical protein GCM10012275_39270 [Longimycelium tulufanense]|uniref:Uncharacterized protein n=1 Tax=Longimycelium tulufanense TaxID=907463 RepID=A0A8J3FVM9_9PSEU|nr:hypothetical protein [Longimycelium tulufanense]GGM64820.1 hypothetical protein GCM10012275_39270 [Longimycelium tulufanense]